MRQSRRGVRKERSQASSSSKGKKLRKRDLREQERLLALKDSELAELSDDANVAFKSKTEGPSQMLASLVPPGKEVVTVGKEVKARRLKKKERIALEKAAMLQKIAELEEYKA